MPFMFKRSSLLVIFSLWYFLKIIEDIFEKIYLAFNLRLLSDFLKIFEANSISLDWGPYIVLLYNLSRTELGVFRVKSILTSEFVLFLEKFCVTSSDEFNTPSK